jgi:broad specificity phosphatase PhoE
MSKTSCPVIVTHSGVIRSFLAAMDILPEEEIFTVDIAYGQIVKIENREFELI